MLDRHGEDVRGKEERGEKEVTKEELSEINRAVRGWLKKWDDFPVVGFTANLKTRANKFFKLIRVKQEKGEGEFVRSTKDNVDEEEIDGLLKDNCFFFTMSNLVGNPIKHSTRQGQQCQSSARMWPNRSKATYNLVARAWSRWGMIICRCCVSWTW